MLVYDPVTGCADTSSTYSFTLGIGNILSDNGISVFPNPFNGSKLFETIKDPLPEKIFINIYNALGRCVISDYVINSQVTQIDLERIPAGIYFISVDTSGGRKQFKLIKS